MTQPPFSNSSAAAGSQEPDLTPLSPGTRAGDYRILSMLGQEGIRGATVQHYRVEDARLPQDAAQEPLELRRILPPPPTALTEAEWLAAVQARADAGERQAFADALAAWSDAQASYLVSRPREGQSLQQYLAAHPSLTAQDGELLARGLLGVLAGLHSAGLHLPELTPAQVWLGRDGSVGLHDLWAALGHGSVGGDLRRTGELLRGAVQVPAPNTPLARLLDALGAPASSGLPISAHAALRLLDRPAPLSAVPATTADAAPPSPLVSAATQPLTPQTTDHTHDLTTTTEQKAPRPLWPWLLPVAGLLLGGIIYLGWPQLSEALREKTAPSPPSMASASTTEQSVRTNAAAPQPGDAAQVMTVPATLNLRPGADASGTPLAAIPSRTLLPVLSQKGEWSKVRYGELTGWVSGQHVLPVLNQAEVTALTQAAAKGGRVTLTRGVYLLESPLELRWDTELMGQGREQTYLLGRQGEYVLSSRDVRLTLENLTVAWTGRTPGHAVLVERGTFTAQGVWLTGGVPDSAQRARGSGLWLRSGAQAQITASLFSLNAIGISVEGSRLNLTDSQLGNNRFAGAVFSAEAGGEMQGNLLDSNGEHGVIISGGASPTLTENHIKGSGQRGLDIGGAASPTVQNNRIEGGEYSVSISGQATPLLSGNTLSGATEGGLFYRAQAAGTAENNAVSAVQTGIRVDETAAPTLRGNQLLQMRSTGISYSSSAGGQATENVIEGAGDGGITLSGQASPVLEGNRIQGGAQSGIVVEGQSQAQLRRNTVQGQAQHGVVVKGEAAPVLEQNALLDNGGYGLVFKEAAGGSGERNLCRNNRAGPASVQLHPSVFGPLFGRDGCMDGVTWPAPTEPQAPAKGPSDAETPAPAASETSTSADQAPADPAPVDPPPVNPAPTESLSPALPPAPAPGP
ncbi:hypothetical protein GCM10017783_03280 [Deinococcus piscis]|uniref:Uncharacterized protein n=1 Tax=Deinococcus piscis TaxID=394230 RepID=A0ABQ3K073_9DEIO|nr:right-handed parallel beta-helix repeat-containing protein [Deinococcus piscis]GHF94583.1 hypothetical protein GCM10017783_03280 [Deinococcus piscis]